MVRDKLKELADTPTVQLLRVIGSPYVGSNSEFSTQHPEDLYHYAIKNRIPLLYLKALRKFDRLGNLQREHDKLVDRFVKIETAFRRISEVLDGSGISYGFFKSVRPYEEVTVDIDILIFGSKYEEALRALYSADYMFLGRGPLSTTFRDKESRINLDIYDEVGVSHIVYLDKDALMKFVGNRDLSNGFVVRSLSPEADLLAVIAHSIIKEHMYVLSEYYTTLYYLADANSRALSSFLSLVDECRMHSAVKTHLGATALLHYGAHAFIPICLKKLLDELGLNHLELSRVKERGFHMPHKYHPLTVTKALIEKLGESKANKSFVLQASSMLNPKFASSVVKEMLHRISRETY
jgi:hypothetical protein